MKNLSAILRIFVLAAVMIFPANVSAYSLSVTALLLQRLKKQKLSNKKKLLDFQKKLSKLKFFDPAANCKNKFNSLKSC